MAINTKNTPFLAQKSPSKHIKLLMKMLMKNPGKDCSLPGYLAHFVLLYSAVETPTIAPMQVQRAAEIVVTISA